MREDLPWPAYVALGFMVLIVLVISECGCSASHGGPTCEDARERLQELSCVEGYAEPFGPVCAELDVACVIEAVDCTEARECKL